MTAVSQHFSPVMSLTLSCSYMCLLSHAGDPALCLQVCGCGFDEELLWVCVSHTHRKHETEQHAHPFSSCSGAVKTRHCSATDVEVRAHTHTLAHSTSI